MSEQLAFTSNPISARVPPCFFSRLTTGVFGGSARIGPLSPPGEPTCNPPDCYTIPSLYKAAHASDE